MITTTWSAPSYIGTVMQITPLQYQGHVSATLVLGGVDCTGPHLHTVYPHGSTVTLPFATMGSGSLAAMLVFESRGKREYSLCPKQSVLVSPMTWVAAAPWTSA